MLDRLQVRGFKSLEDVQLELPRLTVFFGTNAAGKSNLLDAVQALSRIGTARTLADALSEPIRGYPVEAFHFPQGGRSELLAGDHAEFSLAADLTHGTNSYRYRVRLQITPESGALAVADEYLANLDKHGNPKGIAAIELVDGRLRVRRKGESGKPRYEPVGQNFAQVSDPRLSAPPYPAVEAVRSELSDWRTYYLDPRVAMRSAQTPSDVRDIGVLGGDIAPFLYRLRADHPKRYQGIQRTLRSIIPSIESLDVDLDKRRGTLDILVRQDGVDYSSRIVSEGTLQVLALCSIAANPWGGSLLAFEEPENGVHPRRVELIAKLMVSLALEEGRQILVTTHSPLFCNAVLRSVGNREQDVRLYGVRREDHATRVRPLEPAPLFRGGEVRDALTSGSEEGLFESLLMRGLLGE